MRDTWAGTGQDFAVEWICGAKDLKAAKGATSKSLEFWHLNSRRAELSAPKKCRAVHTIF
jgi:hypothetical protein